MNTLLSCARFGRWCQLSILSAAMRWRGSARMLQISAQDACTLDGLAGNERLVGQIEEQCAGCAF
eukprot:3225346-Rhodomonas_salina.4